MKPPRRLGLGAALHGDRHEGVLLQLCAGVCRSDTVDTLADGQAETRMKAAGNVIACHVTHAGCLPMQVGWTGSAVVNVLVRVRLRWPSALDRDQDQEGRLMQFQLGIVVTHRHLDRLDLLLEGVRPLRADHLLPGLLTVSVSDELDAHWVIACAAVVRIVGVGHVDMRFRKRQRRRATVLVIGAVVESDIFIASRSAGSLA